MSKRFVLSDRRNIWDCYTNCLCRSYPMSESLCEDVKVLWGISGVTCREFFFFSSRRRHTRFDCDWSSDVCSSDLNLSWSGHCSRAAPMKRISLALVFVAACSQHRSPAPQSPEYRNDVVAQKDVTWTQLVNATASGSAIVKSGGQPRAADRYSTHLH